MANSNMNDIADPMRNEMTTDNVADLGKSASRKARSTVDQARQTGNDAVDSAADMAQSAIGSAERAARSVDQYITANPMRSVLMAFVAGMFIRKIV